MTRTLRIGTRGSDLALWQARWVQSRLPGAALVIITTKGDRVQDRDLSAAEGVGFFTKELEHALLVGEVDVAVHSLKDLPVVTAPGLHVAGIPERAPAADVLLARPDAFDPSRPVPLKPGSRVGASSLRRRAFAADLEPDLVPTSLRGNVPTRVRRCQEGEFEAIVLAEAGLSRLGLDVSPLIISRMDEVLWPPAPGQGALGIEVRADDDEAVKAVAALDHAPTRACVWIERQVLAAFDGGCHLPLGVLARPLDKGFSVVAALSPEAGRVVRAKIDAADEKGAVDATVKALKDAQAGTGRGLDVSGRRPWVRVERWS